MNGLDRLNSKLAKLKGADDEAEQTVPGGTDGILSVILSEIEETLLPREMVLTNENEEGFVLLVAGRRLLRIDSLGGPLSVYAEGSEPCEQVVALFRGPLRDFIDQAQEIGITAGRPHARVKPAQIGCSVDALAQALAASARTAPVQPDDAVSACLKHARAALRLSGGQVVEALGDPDLADRLGAHAGEPGLIFAATSPDPTCTILSGAGPDGLMLARVMAGEEGALMIIPAEARADLVAICLAAGRA